MACTQNKHKPRASNAPLNIGLVEGMNCSIQEYLRCFINGKDAKHSEWSTDVKLFPLYFTDNKNPKTITL